MKHFWKKYSLLAMVFLTGAAVLVIEVIAVRILSPYFGNTLFSVSSILGVVLGALSLGYYLGGRWADKHPTEIWFYRLILISGIFVLFLGVLQTYILPFVGVMLSFISGPLVAALMLFFVPALFLGTLSPYVITLQKKRFPERGVGSISGAVFFWSTVGSITGSLLTGFVFVPLFGVYQIVMATGVLLVMLGGIPLLFVQKKKKKYTHMMIAGALIMTALQSVTLPTFVDGKLIYSQDGVYERLTVFDGTYKDKPTRFFMQDRSHSGAMFLDSAELVFDYTKYYELYKLMEKSPERIAVLGGGIYTIPTQYIKELPDADVDVVEIEPSLYELAKTYFAVEDSPRLHNHIKDARRFLQDSDQPYDVIFSDVYRSIYSMPAHLTTKEFFSQVKERLTDNGIFIGNFIANLSRDGNSFLFSEIKTIQEVFPNILVFAVNDPASVDAQNVIIVGINGNKPLDISHPPSAALADGSVLPDLLDKQVDLDRFELSGHTTLTDNYAPVDNLVAPLLLSRFSDEENDANQAEMMDVIAQQLRYGSRFVTAAGHKKVQNFLQAEMETLADDVVIQEIADGRQETYGMKNVIARIHPEKEKRVVLATHYDTKRFADRDKRHPDQPVPGANDGASGVAVLVELARAIAEGNIQSEYGVDMIFFDGEEGYDFDPSIAADWLPIGSTYFVQHIEELYPSSLPEEVLVIDMVCDRNLQIRPEELSVKNANDLAKTVWKIGQRKYPKQFPDDIRGAVQDDHVPFQDIGIPAVLLIDVTYPPFHTTEDTLEQCSAGSLGTVYDVLQTYLQEKE